MLAPFVPFWIVWTKNQDVSAVGRARLDFAKNVDKHQRFWDGRDKTDSSTSIFVQKNLRKFKPEPVLHKVHIYKLNGASRGVNSGTAFSPHQPAV